MEFVYIDFFSFVAAMRLGSTVKEKKVKDSDFALV